MNCLPSLSDVLRVNFILDIVREAGSDESARTVLRIALEAGITVRFLGLLDHIEGEAVLVLTYLEILRIKPKEEALEGNDSLAYQHHSAGEVPSRDLACHLEVLRDGIVDRSGRSR